MRPEYRRGGLGRRLVEQALQHARNQGIREIELTSWCFNESAHAAFARLGFTPKWVRFGREA